tara:strand:- start:17211 stop:17762 length:552 start_codon:yes stop_codon:yes gene_type:complete
MTSSRRNNRNNFENINLEKKVDQVIEIGRQFVDGVSGTRPGSRRKVSIRGISRKNVNNVTKWVNQKVDSFFEDEEDDWDDAFEGELREKKISYNSDSASAKDFNHVKRKPLTAISLRQSDITLRNQPKQIKASDDNWPDDSDFQINKWKRTSLKPESDIFQPNEKTKIMNKVRNLPKSSRRRV